MMERIVITGYRNYELAVFQENDPKITIIKKVLKNRIRSLIENGAKWFIISGALETEIWSGEVILQLKQEYPEIRLAILFPYAHYYEKWNQKNQEKIQSLIQQADYVAYVSKQPYTAATQLTNHTQFLLMHSDGCCVLYDPEFEGKCRYFLREVQVFQRQHNYPCEQILMDELENAVFED